jgi:zinc/manganese transport system substrate-binding protein
MKRLLQIVALACAALFSGQVFSAINVFACEPEWAALAQELGGDKVSVFAATTAKQDPHRIEARPSLIARARNADLMICSGSELEIGWLPLLLTQSGNDRIQPGSPGYIEASQFVPKLEVPRVVDRSLGDVHPSGNPHIHLDPRNIAIIGDVMTERLVQIDQANAATYQSRARSFRERWNAAMQRWKAKAARLKGEPVVVYHKDMSYFINWAGMREVGSLEPKPGLPPTPSHLGELVERLKRGRARVIVTSPYNNPQAAEFLSARAGIPVQPLPFTVGGSEKANDLFGLFDDTIDRLVATVQ